MVAIKVQISESQAERLDALARRLNVPSDTLAASAVEAMLELDNWHAGEIRAGLAEAEAGDFATDEELQAVFQKFAARP